MHIDLHSTVHRLHNTLDALETGSLRPFPRRQPAMA